MAVVLATRNPGKAREFGRLLGETFRVASLPEEVELPPEIGSTFAQNARLKGEAVFAALGRTTTVLADDSGLEVAALEGRPGVLSARYAGDAARDEDNVTKLLTELKGRKEREARFVCALCLVLAPAGPESSTAPRLVEVQGVVEGSITEAPRGTGGFGYDPVFRPLGAQQTLAETDPVGKDRVSHRGAAVRALLLRLASEGILSRGS